MNGKCIGGITKTKVLLVFYIFHIFLLILVFLNPPSHRAGKKSACDKVFRWLSTYPNEVLILFPDINFCHFFQDSLQVIETLNE
jgi:hypothetical protein